MIIKGFVHDDECLFISNAIIASVEIVSKYTADHRAGVFVGYMDLVDGTHIKVYRHPGGTYHGYEE